MPEEKLQISLVTDAGVFNDCARMMQASDPWITLGMNYEQCRFAFEGPCKEIYVAEFGNKLTGFVILQVCGTFKGYIQTICVDDNSRGRGIGKQILRFCERRILAISPNIFICVSSFNKGAIKLYYETGFKLVGELTDFVKQGFTELLLRKSIGPIFGYGTNEEKRNK
ncbi:MAG: GNAT family N-acetyltransferase [Chitinophagales bacterium]